MAKKPSPHVLTVSQVRRAINILRDTSDLSRAYALCGGGPNLRRALERLAGMKLPIEPRAFKRGLFLPTGTWRLYYKLGAHPVHPTYAVIYFADRWTGTKVSTSRRWRILSSGPLDEAVKLARSRMRASGLPDELKCFVEAAEAAWGAAGLDTVAPESPFWLAIVYSQSATVSTPPSNPA